MSGETGLHLFAEEDSKEEKLESPRHLIFRLNSYFYAVQLLNIKQVCEPIALTAIANTVPYFLGLGNIQGEVVGVIDLCLMLKLEATGPLTKKALLVFATNSGLLGAVVDEIVGVLEITEKEIDRKAHIKSKVAQEYLLGIAKIQERFINIINLEKILTEDDLVLLKKYRK